MQSAECRMQNGERKTYWSIGERFHCAIIRLLHHPVGVR